MSNKAISKYVKKDITQYSEEELCQIYNALNQWDWDSILGEKPKNWDKMSQHRKHKIVQPIRNHIESEIGRKKLLEWHWIHSLGKTKEEYDEWLFKEMADSFLKPQNRY